MSKERFYYISENGEVTENEGSQFSVAGIIASVNEMGCYVVGHGKLVKNTLFYPYNVAVIDWRNWRNKEEETFYIIDMDGELYALEEDLNIEQFCNKVGIEPAAIISVEEYFDETDFRVSSVTVIDLWTEKLRELVNGVKSFLQNEISKEELKKLYEAWLKTQLGRYGFNYEGLR